MAAAVVLLDSADAQAAPEGVRDAIALTPAALLTARRERPALACAAADLMDRGHARCVAAARRALAQFDRVSARHELPQCVRLLGRQSAWQLGALSLRLVRSLPGAPVLARDRHGAWHSADNASLAQELLLPRIFEWGLGHRSEARRAVLPLFHTWLTARAAMRARNGGPWIVTTSRKLKLGLDGELRKAGGSIASVGTTSGGWRDYAALIRAFLRRGAAFNVSPVEADHGDLQKASALFREVSASYDPLTRSAWCLYMPYLEANSANALAMLRTAPVLMAALGAKAAITYEGNSWLAAGLLEAALTAGRTSAVVNHNSHAKTGSATADEVLGFLFRQRTASPVVGISAQWTPQWRNWADRPTRARFLPYRAKYPAPPPAGPRFRVLHAGNYQNWSDFIPWIAETSNEYVAGLAALARVVAATPDMDLVIRVRSKPEVDPDIVRESIPAAPNVTVSDTSEDFLAQLAGCDLLVSHFSTTVEQALQMGKPVLLWGSTARYCQLAASWTPPAAGKRAAIYAAADERGLASMLRAVRERHWQQPLSAAEVAAYRNSPGDPDVSGLAAMLLQGA